MTILYGLFKLLTKIKIKKRGKPASLNIKIKSQESKYKEMDWIK